MLFLDKSLFDVWFQEITCDFANFAPNFFVLGVVEREFRPLRVDVFVQIVSVDAGNVEIFTLQKLQTKLRIDGIFIDRTAVTGEDNEMYAGAVKPNALLTLQGPNLK